MKTYVKIIIGVIAWAAIALIVVPPVATSCASKKERQEYDLGEKIIDEGLLRNDSLIVVQKSDGRVSIKNEKTGKVTIKDIKLDWTQESSDSLAVFCSENKRGYYSMYTGEIVVPAQYRRAWIFSEGLAAVQRNGMIGFIDRSGNVAIDFKFPYHGNPLNEFVFKNGHCVVADTLGRCGVIDRSGKWLIEPDYDNISDYREYAIVSKAGVRMQVSYDGTVLNSFVLDDIKRLTFSVEERFENREGELEYVSKDVDTGLFSYRVGGRCGLMDANCHRLTEPLYSYITAVDMNMFRATLIDGYSEVILNAKGEVMR